MDVSQQNSVNVVSTILNAVISRLEYSVFPVVTSTLRDDINRMIAPQLRRTGTITPTQEQLVIEAIVRRYKDAAIKEHEPVGVNAALTTGENLTQSSLQSHHHAGLKRGAAGFDRIEEITNMKNKSNIVKVITTPHRVRSSPGNIVQYVPRSKIEINELANLLIKVLMDDIVIDYEIRTANPLPVPVGGFAYEFPEWYSIFTSIKAIATSGLKPRWLRIYINPEMMFKYRISLPAIALVIGENIGQNAYILYPPSQLGLYIDIHMNVTSDADYYLKLSDIQSLLVGGIDSVESAAPIPENLLTNLKVLEVNSATGLPGCPRVYELVSSAPAFVPPFAWERMIRAMVPDAQMVGESGKRFCSNIPIDDLREMILQAPVIYADVIDSRREINIDDIDPDIGISYRQEILSIGDPAYEPFLTGNNRIIRITFQQNIVNRFPYLEHADLTARYFLNDEEANRYLLEVMVEYHFFWYIEAICEKVQDLYVLPEVDSTRTYTTSPLDCRDTLGYMAMRNMIYREFRENIGINPIHVKLIINNMTLYKEPVSIRRQSVRNDKSEWLTYTSFEDVLKYLTFAAFAGEEDHMQSVSSHVLTGRIIEIGRGGNNMPKTSRDNPTGNRYVQMKLDEQRRREREGESGTRGRGRGRGGTTRGRGRGTTPTTPVEITSQ